MRIGALAVVVSASLAFILMRRLGPAGIALAASTGAYVNAGLLVHGLTRRLGSIVGTAEVRALGITVVGSLVATGLGAAIASGAAALAPWMIALIALSGFGAVYIGVTAALAHPDARRLASVVWRKVDGRRG